jgi:hypothetical protein
MVVKNNYAGVKMDEAILRLNRIDYTDKQVTGELKYLDINKEYFSCFTLELPDLNNQHEISCIPKGTYEWEKCNPTKKFPYEHLNILNVQGRGGIKVHVGNYHYQILGCILVGETLTDINKDGYKDVTSSGETLKKLMDILPDKGKIIII